MKFVHRICSLETRAVVDVFLLQDLRMAEYKLSGGSDGRSTGGPFLDSLMPVVLFLIMNRFAGLGWAVAGATLWSVKVAVSRRRRGEVIGKFLPMLLAYLVARGIVGVLTDSEAVYFGIGIGAKTIVGALLIGTSLVGRPILSRALHLLIPVGREIRFHAAYKRMTKILTFAFGAWLLVTSAFDFWLFNQTSTDGYVIIRAIASWPAGVVLTLLGFWYIDRSLRVVPGFSGILDLLEKQQTGRGHNN